MTLAEFFKFLYDNGLDYSVNVMQNQKRSCVNRGCMIIAISKRPMFVRIFEDNEPLFFYLQDVTLNIKRPSPINILPDFNVTGVCGYVLAVDLNVASMNSDMLLVLAKKIWEEYIHADR